MIDYIKKHGGYIPGAIKATGANINRATVRKYARKKGIDIRDWRYANHSFGYWRVLPGNIEKMYVADYRVNAECTLCGSVYPVLITNLRSGVSTCCINCAARSRRRLQVRCLDTDKLFRSVRAFSLAMDGNKNYQMWRYHFNKFGKVEVEGKTYVLEEKD